MNNAAQHLFIHLIKWTASTHYANDVTPISNAANVEIMEVWDYIIMNRHGHVCSILDGAIDGHCQE